LQRKSAVYIIITTLTHRPAATELATFSPKTSMHKRRHFFVFAMAVGALGLAPLARAELGCSPGTGADLSALVDEIASLPEGGWLRVNTNRYDEVWTPPDLRPSSGALLSTPSKIIQAWSSFAWDCRRGDILLYGGGHANYSGNDTYRWRATTRRWERMSLPSDIRVDGMGNTTAIDGPFAAPPAAHTYDNNIYLPFIDRFLVLGGSAWNNGGAFEMQTGPDTERITGPYVFDLRLADGARVGGTTGSQVNPAAHPGILGGLMWQNRDLYTLLPVSTLPSNHTSGSTAYAGAGNSDVVLFTARQGLGTAQHLFRYELVDADDASKDTVARIGRFLGGQTGRGAGTYDPDLNVFVRTVIGSTASNFYYWDLTKAGVDNPSVIFSPFDSSGEWRLDRGYGMDFDPVRGQYLLWGGKADVWSMRAPATTSANGWTIDKMPPASTPATPTSSYDGVSLEAGGGVLGKWKYIPEIDAFIGLQDTAAGNVWIYKPTGWVRPGTAAPPTLNFSSSARQLFAGGNVTLQWRSKGATSCTADGAWSGQKPSQGSQVIAALASTSTFGLRCDGPAGNVRRSVTVVVDPVGPPTINAIGADSCVNASEAASGLTLSGSGRAGATLAAIIGPLSRSTLVDASGNWRIVLSATDVSALPQGALSVSVRQTLDQTVYSPATALTLSKDTIAPSATTTPPQLQAASDTGVSSTDGLTRDTTPTYRGVASAASTPIALLIDGAIVRSATSGATGEWSATAPTVAGGPHLVAAASSDACGNLGPASAAASLTIDAIAPALSVDAVAADNRINRVEAQQAVTVGGTSEANAVVTLQIAIGTSSLLSRTTTSAGVWSQSLPASEVGPLPEGPLTLTVTASDAAGNPRTVRRTITKDTQNAAPSIGPVAGDDVMSPSELSVPVIVSGRAEAKAVVTLTVNGWTRDKNASTSGDWSLEVPRTVLSALPAGPVQFQARSVDLAGNESPATSRTVTVISTN
jgi:hypothetical protein